MSTKLSNEHIRKITEECKEYKILDTYIVLSYISSEVKSGKYLIQTYSDKRSNLINIVHKYMPNTCYKTISNCIDKLISMDVLVYNEILSAWCLNEMENMTKSKSEAEDEYEASNFTGYTHIRKFFLSENFFNMRAREKRLILYICQLLDSKASKHYDNISINLLKYNNNWLKILKTKCKYYAQKTINTMLKKYKDIFFDFSSSVRERDLAPKSVSNFKFTFTCESLSNRNKEDDMFELIKIKNVKEYELVKDKVKFAGITLTKQEIMHLVRAISTLKEWFLKERIVQLIVNKYIAIQIHKSREKIHSLPKYAAAVVKAVVDEYNRFKVTYDNNKLNTKVENYYASYIENEFNTDNYVESSSIMKLLENF